MADTDSANIEESRDNEVMSNDVPESTEGIKKLEDVTSHAGHRSQSEESVVPTVGSLDSPAAADDVSSQSVASSVTDSMAESTTATIGSSIHGADPLTTIPSNHFTGDAVVNNIGEDEQPSSETPEPIVPSSEPDPPNPSLVSGTQEEQTPAGQPEISGNQDHPQEGESQQQPEANTGIVDSLLPNELSSLTDGQQITDMAALLEAQQQSHQQEEYDTNVQGGNEVAPLPFVLESQVIMVNGEQHTLVSQAIDESTGEQLVILESASGSQFALPLSTLTGSIQTDDGQQQPQSEQPILQQDQQQQDLVGQALVQDVASTMIDGLANIAVNQQPLQNDFSNINGGVPHVSEVVSPQQETLTVSQSVTNQAATTVVDSNGQTLVQGGIVSDSSGNQFVIMTEGVSDSAGQQINLTDVIEAGQVSTDNSNAGNFILQTEDVTDTGIKQQQNMTQIISEGPPLTSHEEAIIQAVTASGNLTEGQIIHCVSEGVTMAYQIGSASNGELSLIQLGPVDAKQQTANQKKGRVTNRFGNSIVGQQQQIYNTSPTGKKRPVQSSLSVTARSNSGKMNPLPKTIGTDISITRVSNASGKVLPKNFPYSSAENSSLLTGSLPGPSQLASSRKTYSRKNIVWVDSNNESAATTSASPPVPAIVSTNENMTVSPATLPPKKSPSVRAAAFNTTVSPTETISRVSKKIEVVQTKKTPEKEESPKKASPAKEVILETKADTNGTPEVPAIETVVPAPATKRGRRRTASSSDKEAAVVPESPSKAHSKTEAATPKPVAKTETVTPRRGGRPKKIVPSGVVEETPAPTPTVEEAVPVEVLPPPVVAAEAEPVMEEAVKSPEKVGTAPAIGRGGRRKTQAAAPVVKEVTESEAPKVNSENNIAENKTEVATHAVEETGIRRSGRPSKRKVEEDFVDPDVELATKRGARKSVKIAEPVATTNVNDSIEVAEEAMEISDVEPKGVQEAKTSRRISSRRVTTSSVSEAEDEKIVPETPTKKSRKSVTIQEPVSDETATNKTPSKSISFASSSGAATTSAYTSPMSPSKKKLTPILKTTNYTPRGRRLDSPIVETFTPVDQEKINRDLRKSLETLEDKRSSDQKYDIDSSECSIHIRQQSPSLRPSLGADSSYTCQKCGFFTTRMYILVRHHKEDCPAIKNAWMHIWQKEIQQRQSQ
jgi:hypothetical protein